MIFDTKSRTKTIGFIVTISMAFVAAYVAAALIFHATASIENQNQHIYHQVNLSIALVSIIVLSVAYKGTQLVSLMHFVFTSETEGVGHKISRLLVKFLSIVPTPLLIALLFPITFNSANNILVSSFLICVILVVCAAPTASQIIIDGLSGYPRQAYEAAIGLGFSKNFALLNVVAVENRKLFQTSATVGIVRVIVENWILIATTVGLSIYDILNSNNLPSILEKSYSNITSKVGIIYIAILLALTLFGKAWSAIVAGIAKQ